MYLLQNGGYLEKCGNKNLDLLLTEVYAIGSSSNMTIDYLLEQQQKDGFIPMNFIPFCSDEAGDDYYLRIDEKGFGKIYYIFSEFIDDFLENQEKYCVAKSFNEMIVKL